jgi:hypothetical protein
MRRECEEPSGPMSRECEEPNGPMRRECEEPNGPMCRMARGAEMASYVEHAWSACRRPFVLTGFLLPTGMSSCAPMMCGSHE